MLHNLTAPCNANCKCLRSTYYPVCGRDKVQYFSPCYAGCTSSLLTNMKKVLYLMQVADLVCFCFVQKVSNVESVVPLVCR